MLGAVLSGLRALAFEWKVRFRMLDKNGVAIRTGDVVRVSNAFFANDNGTYLVVHSAGDPSWTGNDHCLYRLRRDGKISANKYKTAFWPLGAWTNDKWKNAEARKWNAEHAEIEVIPFEKRDGAREYFAEKADELGESIKLDVWKGWDENCDWIVKNKKAKSFYESVAARLAA